MRFFVNFLLGVTFGFGLILSNVLDPKTINLFLSGSPKWDPSVILTILGIILASSLSLFFLKKPNTNFKNNFPISEGNILNRQIVLGCALFGVGWGLSGLSVSTATINLAFNEWQSVLFFIFMILGFYGPQFYKKITL